MSIIEVGDLYAGHSEVEVTDSGHTYKPWYQGPNSVGGVGVEHKIFNASDKTIKYLTFTYQAYNRVGDAVVSQTSGRSIASGKLTGPIEPKKQINVRWEALWYNPTISKVVLKKIVIQYMDNSEETVEGDQILSMSDENSEYKKQEDARIAAEAARKAEEQARRAQEIEEIKKKATEAASALVGGIKGLFKKK